MLDQLKCLIEYQKIEDKKNSLVRSGAETPRRIAELQMEFDNFEGEYLSKKEEYENARKSHKAIEQEIESLQARLARQKTKQGEVKTNKEYQAIIKEMEESKKELSRNEELALGLMQAIEELAGKLKDMEKGVTERRTKMEAEQVVLRRQNDLLKSRLDKLDSLLQRVRNRVSPELLKKTEFLLFKQAGIAVSSVENGVCQMCHMNIPPQKFIELQRDEAIMQCPNCHRFLYWPGHEGYCISEEEIDRV